jgi:methyl-accepting chemotaxis protein
MRIRYAVVAEEIRRLADANARGSDENAYNIRDNIAKTKEAGETRGATIRTFDTITRQTHSVSESVREIYGNVNGMQVGSHQILESMETRKKNSAETTTESGRIDHSIWLCSRARLMHRPVPHC